MVEQTVSAKRQASKWKKLFKGKPIRVRYLWNATTTPHWEQAFSDDGGRSWETNWTMDFTKAE